MATRDLPSGHLSYHVETIRMALGQLIAELHGRAARELCAPIATSLHELSCCVVDMEQRAESAHAAAERAARIGRGGDPSWEVEQWRSAETALLELLRAGPHL